MSHLREQFATMDQKACMCSTPCARSGQDLPTHPVNSVANKEILHLAKRGPKEPVWL